RSHEPHCAPRSGHRALRPGEAGRGDPAFRRVCEDHLGSAGAGVRGSGGRGQVPDGASLCAPGSAAAGGGVAAGRGGTRGRERVGAEVERLSESAAVGGAPASPGSFGAWYRRQRELRGISLFYVAARTKLSPERVREIED